MAKNSTWDDIRPSYKAQQTMVTVVAEREGQTIETTVIPKWNKIVLRLASILAFTRETYSIGESLLKH